MYCSVILDCNTCGDSTYNNLLSGIKKTKNGYIFPFTSCNETKVLEVGQHLDVISPTLNKNAYAKKIDPSIIDR